MLVVHLMKPDKPDRIHVMKPNEQSKKIHTCMTVSFEQQEIHQTSCSGCPQKALCAHVLCAILHRITHPDKVII